MKKRSPSPSRTLQVSCEECDALITYVDTCSERARGSFAPAAGLGPAPASFSGGCVSTGSFNASAYYNNKIIGAKFFYKGYETALGHPIDDTKESKSPLDTEGHGTHTASTAAGSPVTGAGFFDYADGQAVGMAPSARIAAYKICW